MPESDQKQATWQALAARIIADASVPYAPGRAAVGVSPLLIHQLRIELDKARKQRKEVA
jgi:hypothetical protein